MSRVSSVGRARDWKSLCPWFDSETRHHFKRPRNRSFFVALTWCNCNGKHGLVCTGRTIYLGNEAVRASFRGRKNQTTRTPNWAKTCFCDAVRVDWYICPLNDYTWFLRLFLSCTDRMSKMGKACFEILLKKCRKIREKIFQNSKPKFSFLKFYTQQPHQRYFQNLILLGSWFFYCNLYYWQISIYGSDDRSQYGCTKENSFFYSKTLNFK